MQLTELEKSVMVSVYVISKGSKARTMKEEEITAKFPMRQRKMVRNYIKELVGKNLLVMDRSGYRLEEKGLKEVSSILIGGFRARF